MKRILDRKTRRDIAYGMYSRNAIRRFDLEGKIEIIRQQVDRTAPGENTMSEHIRQLLDQDLVLDDLRAFGVRPSVGSLKRSHEA
jgi:hypothetical protein